MAKVKLTESQLKGLINKVIEENMSKPSDQTEQIGAFFDRIRNSGTDRISNVASVIANLTAKDVPTKVIDYPNTPYHNMKWNDYVTKYKVTQQDVAGAQSIMKKFGLGKQQAPAQVVQQQASTTTQQPTSGVTQSISGTTQQSTAATKKAPNQNTMKIQQQLKDDGFYQGKIDGIWGKDTQAAYEASKAREKRITTKTTTPLEPVSSISKEKISTNFTPSIPNKMAAPKINLGEEENINEGYWQDLLNAVAGKPTYKKLVDLAAVMSRIKTQNVKSFVINNPSSKLNGTTWYDYVKKYKITKSEVEQAKQMLSKFGIKPFSGEQKPPQQPQQTQAPQQAGQPVAQKTTQPSKVEPSKSA